MVVFGQKLLYSVNVVVFGQKLLSSGKNACIPAMWLYSGKSGCNREKAVVIRQNWLYSCKVV